MPLATSKQQLLQDLANAYHKLVAELADIPPSLTRKVEFEGDVSCCDLIAYQLGWGRLLMGWEQAEHNNQTVYMPAKGFNWGQQKALSAKFYLQYRGTTYAELLTHFAQLHQQLSAWIESLSEPELFALHQRQWTGEKWPLAKWIQVNSIAPYRSARTKLRRWKKQQQLACC